MPQGQSFSVVAKQIYVEVEVEQYKQFTKWLHYTLYTGNFNSGVTSGEKMFAVSFLWIVKKVA